MTTPLLIIINAGADLALLGLLGMLAGEQAVALVGSHLFKSDVQLGASRDRGEAAMADDVRGAEEN